MYNSDVAGALLVDPVNTKPCVSLANVMGWWTPGIGHGVLACQMRLCGEARAVGISIPNAKFVEMAKAVLIMRDHMYRTQFLPISIYTKDKTIIITRQPFYKQLSRAVSIDMLLPHLPSIVQYY